MFRFLLIVTLSCVILCGCQEKKHKTIILSKAGDNYIKWIEDENIVVLDAYNIDNMIAYLLSRWNYFNRGRRYQSYFI